MVLHKLFIHREGGDSVVEKKENEEGKADSSAVSC